MEPHKCSVMHRTALNLEQTRCAVVQKDGGKKRRETEKEEVLYSGPSIQFIVLFTAMSGSVSNI